MSDRRARVVDVLQRLREQEAVESVGRDGVRGGEVGDDRRVTVRRDNVEDVLLSDVDAEALRVLRVLDLEHAAPNRRAVLVQEALDEIAVDRRSAIEAKAVAERRGPAKGPQPRRTSHAANPLASRHSTKPMASPPLGR